ncbi:hypothetical protein, partial [Escherichia coli]|uniref:hypothetical protein n=1 Tax=Escherichia coli TaxID=562 RepID=UPI0028FC2194
MSDTFPGWQCAVSPTCTPVKPKPMPALPGPDQHARSWWLGRSQTSHRGRPSAAHLAAYAGLAPV